MNANRKKKLLGLVNTYSSELIALGVAIIAFILFTNLSSVFCTVKNFTSISRYSSVYGLVAIGMSFVIFNGNIDLSVGYQVGMISILLGFMMKYTTNIAFLVISGILLGIICGVLNGYFVSQIGLPAFVATIGLGKIYNGIGHLVAGGTKILFENKPYRFIGRYNLFGFLPFSFLFFLIVMITAVFVLKQTVFGRSIYAVGCNKEAAFLAGIKTDKTVWLAYIICGFLCGCASVIVTSQNGAGIVTSMDGAEMAAISAVVLGGGSMNGGKGTIWGTIIGVFILRIIANGMNLINLPSYWQMVTQGSLLILAVIFDSLKNNPRE